MKSIKNILLLIFIIFLLFEAVVYLYKNYETENIEKRSNSKNETIFKRDYSFNFGENKKNLVVVQFIDPESYPSKQVYSIIDKIHDKYNNDINIVLKYLPTHKNSEEIIKILEASRYQNKYKEALNIIFEKQDLWSAFNSENPDLIWNFLKVIKNLDIKQLKIDKDNIEIKNIISQDKKDAKILKIDKSPVVYVNSKRLSTLSYKELVLLIENELKD
ncbi:DsbA family protein [Poseidonibacter sp.]|uniref:DsbA family protein n=1 Tax=Poseidonibacter sp. TaxID=2321188 RepID=UPI003C71C85F